MPARHQKARWNLSRQFANLPALASAAPFLERQKGIGTSSTQKRPSASCSHHHKQYSHDFICSRPLHTSVHLQVLVDATGIIFPLQSRAYIKMCHLEGVSVPTLPDSNSPFRNASLTYANDYNGQHTARTMSTSAQTPSELLRSITIRSCCRSPTKPRVLC